MRATAKPTSPGHLRRRLGGAAKRFEFAFDATAMMNSADRVTPVIECWRRAQNAGKRMVLAINQYPLYMLRQEIRKTLPNISEEIERQWKARLTTGSGGSEPAGDSLILVDLSLRNPLSREFSGRVLDRMLADLAVQRHAASGMDTNFSFNFERLANEGVEERLFELFDRVISSGQRTTVRELWILTAPPTLRRFHGQGNARCLRRLVFRTAVRPRRAVSVVQRAAGRR